MLTADDGRNQRPLEKENGWVLAAEILCFLGLGFSCIALAGAPTWVPPLLKILFALSLGLHLLPGLARGDLAYPLSLLDLLAILFVSLGVLSALFSDIPHEAFKRLEIGISYAILFFVAGRLSWRKRSVYRWAIFVIMLGTLEATYGLMAHLRGWHSILGWLKPRIYVARLSGTFINPNHFGSLMVLLIPVAWMAVTLPQLALAKKLVAGYVAALMTAAMVMTYSRGAWAATFLAMFWAGLIMIRKGPVIWRWALAVLIGALIAGVLVWAGELEDQLFRRSDLTRISRLRTEQSRFYAWADTMDMALRVPLTGVGLGGYAWKFPMYQSVDIARQKMDYAHNDYLETSAELGLGGLFLQVGLTLGIALVGLAGRRKLVNRKVKGLATGMLAGFAGVSIHALIDFPLRIPAVGCMYSMMGGCLVGLSAQKGVCGKMVYPARDPRMRRVLFLATLLLITACVLTGILSLKSTLAFRRGNQFRDNLFHEEAFGQYERAARLDRDNWKAYCEMGDIRFMQSMWITYGDRRQDLREEARSLYEKALELNPWHSKTYIKLAHVELWSKDRAKAESLYAKALEVDPHNLYLRHRYAQIFQGARIRGHHHRNRAFQERHEGEGTEREEVEDYGRDVSSIL